MSNRTKAHRALAELPSTAIVGGFVEDLIGALQFAAPAMSQEQTRYYLCGMRIDFNGSHVIVRATDGHRMHVTKFAGTWEGKPATCLFSADAVHAILAKFRLKKAQRNSYGGKAGWRLEYATQRLFIGDEDAVWQGEPGSIDLDRVQPLDPEFFFACSADVLKPMLDAACAIDRTPVLKIEATGAEALQLSAKAQVSAGRTKSQSRLDMVAKVDGASVAEGRIGGDVGFNARYLRDIAQRFGWHAPLYVKQRSAGDPALITAGDSDQYAILMPCRV